MKSDMAPNSTRSSDRSWDSRRVNVRQSVSDEIGYHTTKIPQPSKKTKHEKEPVLLQVVTKSCSAPSTVRAKGIKYDIPTLLNIGRQLENKDNGRNPDPNFIGIIGRRTTDSRRQSLADRSINHSRTSTSISIDAEESCQKNQSTSLQFPRRQPKTAPEGTLAQTNEGFARFLKEHSSPKLHRVTAGGRIVPMSLLSSPAPEFKLPIANSDGSGCQKVNKPTADDSTQKSPAKGDSKVEVGSQRQRKPRVVADHKPVQAKRLSISAKHTESKTTPVSTGVQQYRTPVLVGPSTVSQPTPSQLGTHGSAGPNNEQSLNGKHFAQERMSQPIPHTAQGREDQSGSPFANLQQYYSQPHVPSLFGDTINISPQTPYVTQVGNTGTYSATPNLAMIGPTQLYQMPGIISNPYLNLTPGMNTIQPAAEPADDRGCLGVYENAIQGFENLSAQLTNLDRYLALHSWDIDPTNKKVLVAQRMELVTKLDAARVLKENLEEVLRPSLSHDSQAGSNISPQHLNPYAPAFTASGLQPTSWSPSSVQESGCPQYEQRTTGTTPGVSFASTDPASYMSPAQTNGIPYSTADTFDVDYQNLLVPNQAIANNSLTNGWSMGINGFGNTGDDESVNIITSATGETVAEPNDNWIPPPEIIAIYRKMEEAASRNEALGPLFQELAKVTALMNAPISNKSRRPDGCLQHSRWNQPSDFRQTPGITTNSCGSDDGQRMQQSNLQTTNCQPHSQIVMDIPKEQKGTGKNGPRCNNDNNRQRARGSISILTDSNPNLHKSTNMPKGGQTSQLHDLGTDGSSDDRITNLRLNDATTVDSRVPIKTQLMGHLKVDKVVEKSASEPRSTPQKNALSFTSCKQNGGQSGSSRKVETLAAAQKIHAKGFLPPFDGSGDAKDAKATPERGNSGTSLNNDGNKTNGGNIAVNGNSAQDYGKLPRRSPNAMDVRAFFQMLREEDKEAIRNHRTRAFG